MQYLTAPELAELLSCQKNQFAVMARRLKASGWPFEQVKGCCPKVLRAYHDQRMQGLAQVAPVAVNAPLFSPNRAALQALQHGRKHKAA